MTKTSTSATPSTSKQKTHMLGSPREAAKKIHEGYLNEYSYVDASIAKAVETVIRRQWGKDNSPRDNLVGRTPYFHYPSKEDYPWYESDIALFVAGNIRALAIGRAQDACWLWLYNQHSEYLIEQPRNNAILLISPEVIEQAEIDGDQEFKDAFELILSAYPVIYDERIGDGYDYECGNSQCIFSDPTPEMFPQELFFLAGTLEVSFITDSLASNYDIRPFHGNAHWSQKLREERYCRAGKPKVDEPGCAYQRMFNGGLFEFACVMPCLNKELQRKAMEMWENMRGRSGSAFRLSQMFGGQSHQMHKNADTAEIELTMREAVIAWEHGHLGWEIIRSLYILMDTQPEDDELYTFVGAVMQHSGNVELVCRARRENKRIWELL